MKRKVDGVLLLDKPAGLTSNAALQKAKRLYRAEKAGHTGTLDPFATGLLPLCLGEATKFSQFLLDADKVYRAELKFGVRTASGDLDGEVIATRPVDLTEARLRRALENFLGEIEQVPPMHSALKHQGRPLYEYARRGVEIERPPRRVVVRALELESFQGEACVLRIHSGKGFYVRALADDLGEILGCGAHLAGLRRLAVGRFDVAGALGLAELEAIAEAERDARLAPADALIDGLPKLCLDAEAAWQIMHGQAVWLPRLQVGVLHRIYGQGERFLGVAEVGEDGKLAPKRLVVQA
ncbi:MAG: tRNA pseudouridine55 synthase [bacterium]|nr:MAG: tRNA pseudouridine55 synthase [bacterium]KAF0147869.1 MAG: tRNA pseudouridine55 synthase [bacterium]KAF0167470.1 MAG: tRNA pseudouridine55 synthase [bacterium]TXT20994.1 MAG: tRNA pseudouridine55 synthase [bacterium]